MRVADGIERERAAYLRANGWLELPALSMYSVIDGIGLSHPAQLARRLRVRFEVRP